MSTITMVFLVIAIVAIAAALCMYLLMYRTRKLRGQFGPEYDRALEREQGHRWRAESQLEQRKKRVSTLNIRPLRDEDRDRFIGEWRTIQESFVDDPRVAVVLADKLVTEVMQARNYQTGEFEQRAEDLSVEYPDAVQDYRRAHEVAVAEPRNQVSTDDLRDAMQRYRNLLERLTGTSLVQHHEEVRR